MTTCLACRLDFPNSEGQCPVCEISFSGSGTFSIDPTESGFELKASGISLGTVSKREEVLGFRRPGALASDIFVIVGDPHNDGLSTILDRSLAPIAQLRFSQKSRAAKTLRCEITMPHTALALALKMDGPTGLHLTDHRGNIVAVASFRSSSPLEGLDLLLISPDRAWVPMAYFALFVAVLSRLAEKTNIQIPWDSSQGEGSVELSA